VTPELLARSGIALAVLAGLGRVLLACLPPGALGAHSPREIVRTWAASHVLGLVALAASAGLAELFGVSRSLLVLVAPWIVLGALRWLTLPGAFVPGPEPAHERPSTLAFMAGAALAVVAVLPMADVATSAADAARSLVGELGSESAARSPLLSAAVISLMEGVAGAPDPRLARMLTAASFGALCVLLIYAWERARRAPFGRRLFGLLFALTPAVFARASTGGTDLVLALLFAAGCTALVSWSRHADRRAAAFAALAFASCAVSGSVGLAVAGSLVLLGSTHANALRFVGSWCASAWLLLALPGVLSERSHAELDASGPDRLSFATNFNPGLLPEIVSFRRWGLLWLAALAAMVHFVSRRSSEGTSPESSGRIDEPRREVRVLTALLAIGLGARSLWVLLGDWVGEVPAHEAWTSALLPLAAPAALLVGLVFVRAERVPQEA